MHEDDQSDVQSIVVGGLRLVGGDARDQREAEEGDDSCDGEDQEQNPVVDRWEEGLETTADQGSDAASELEHGEKHAVVLACHAGKACD